MLGNSGDLVRHAVVKTAGGVTPSERWQRAGFLLLQARYVQVLRAAGFEALPEVLAELPQAGYVMERLDPAPDDLRPTDVLRVLADLHAMPVIAHQTLRPSALAERLQLPDLVVPSWIQDEPLVAAHGDSTLANVMSRSGKLVLIDPYPPSEVYPSVASIDYACMLQSVMGWERMLAGEGASVYDPLPYIGDALATRRAWWWLWIKTRRIELRENLRAVPRPEVLIWVANVHAEAQARWR